MLSPDSSRPDKFSAFLLLERDKVCLSRALRRNGVHFEHRGLGVVALV